MKKNSFTAKEIENLAEQYNFRTKLVESFINLNDSMSKKEVRAYLKEASGPYALKLCLWPTSGTNSRFMTLKDIADMEDISVGSLTVNKSRKPHLSIQQNVDEIKERSTNRVELFNLRQELSDEGISHSKYKRYQRQYDGKLSHEAIKRLCHSEALAEEQAKELSKKNLGMWKEEAQEGISGQGTWFAMYVDDKGVRRPMQLKEIAELEGLTYSGLSKAVSVSNGTKSIYEIISDMVARKDLTETYDLAEQFGLNRRMFIYRYHKHSKDLPVDAIIALTREDQRRHELTERPERDSLPQVNNMSFSRFAYLSGTDAGTAARRFRSGIEIEQSIGRRGGDKQYEFEGVSLSLVECTQISGLSESSIKRRMAKNPEGSLPEWLELTVDAFYEKISMLSLYWTIPPQRTIGYNTSLFTMDDMVFTSTQLAQIASVAPSTIIRRSHHSKDVLTVTQMTKQEFLTKFDAINMHRANIMDKVAFSREYSAKAELESRCKGLSSSLNKRRQELTNLESWFELCGLPKLRSKFRFEQIPLSPCSNCFSAPLSKFNGGYIIECPDCGKTTEEPVVKLGDAFIEWALRNSYMYQLDTVEFTDVDYGKLLDADVRFSQYVSNLRAYYTCKLEIAKLNNALMNIPSELRSRFNANVKRKDSQTIPAMNRNLKLVGLLHQMETGFSFGVVNSPMRKKADSDTGAVSSS